MTSVFLHFLNLSITAGWMVLAVLLLRLCLKKVPRWITCVLWGLVALRLLVPFSIESPVSLIPTAQTVAGTDTAGTSVPVVNSGLTAIDGPLNDWLHTPTKPPVQSPVPPASDIADPTPQPPSAPEQTPDNTEAKSVSRMEQILRIAAPVWLVGIALMLLYELFSVLRVRSRLLDAVRLRDNIWQSDRVASPFIFGLFRPRIYVPYQLEEPVLEQVLSHERAHLHRRDHWIKPFAFTLLAVYWYNPLLWVGYILLCRDIEVACDQRVIRTMDEDSRCQYATALLQCGVERRSIAACPLAFGEVSIKQRIKSVLNYRKPLLWVIIASLVICGVAAVCLLTVPTGKETPLVVLSTQEIQPNQKRCFYGTDTDGAIIPDGPDWLWAHAENPDQKTADIDMADETNIPLVLSRSKAELDELMDALSDPQLGVDMRYWFELEKYNDSYFEEKAIVWLFVPGYDLTAYDYTVTLEETNKGLRYAVTMDYHSTSMFTPYPDHCEYLLLFEVERDKILQADSLSTRHEKAPIRMPAEDGTVLWHSVGKADLDGDGEEDSIRIVHSATALDGATMVICKADGTPILREAIHFQYYSQCYLLPQEDGSSLLLMIEADESTYDYRCEAFGVLSLKDGVRTVLEYKNDGRSNVGFGRLDFTGLSSYAQSLSGWIENAQLLFECENGSLYYGDKLGQEPRYTPLSFLDPYRNSDNDTLQDILENVIASTGGETVPVGELDFDGDGVDERLSIVRYASQGVFQRNALVVRETDDSILTAFEIHDDYLDNPHPACTYVYRVKTDNRTVLKSVQIYRESECSVYDLSIDGTVFVESTSLADWLDYVYTNDMECLFYFQGHEIYFPETEDSEPASYRTYAELLKAAYDEEIGLRHVFRDLNGDGNEELLLLQNGTKLIVYTLGINGTQLVVEDEFHTGTSRFLDSGDAAYPGLFYFCVGGGKNQCYYLTSNAVTNGQFALTPVWTEEVDKEGTYTRLTEDEKLYDLSRKAYQNDEDIYFSLVPTAGHQHWVKHAYGSSIKEHNREPETYRDLGEWQPETNDVILLDGQQYQSYTASNVNMRYIFVSNEEYAMSAEWDWVPIGTYDDYSLDNLGKIDDSRR